MSASETSIRQAGIEKTPTGIEGFDEISRGGLPKGRTTLVIGGPGSGKTIFSLQTLVNGARRFGEPGILVSFEESGRQLLDNAASFGWQLPALVDNGLFILDARLEPDTVGAGRFDLKGLLAGLEAKVAETGARRIVFDSIDVLLAYGEGANADRMELNRLSEWLHRTGLTGIVTMKSSIGAAESTDRYSFVQYLADCVVSLDQRLSGRVAVREIRVPKYRGSACSENAFPISIGPQGLQVAATTRLEGNHPVFTDRISSGLARLDTMLGGGFYRGSATLVSGSPGTAKTTLAGAFADAACKRTEKVLFVCFDEVADEIVRNLASVNIHLDAHRRSGLLILHTAEAVALSAEQHLLALNALIQEHQPRVLVLDPLSAINKAGDDDLGANACFRLLRTAKLNGVSVLCTSLLSGRSPEVEATPLQVSTIADSWLHLSYVNRGGERNRALTVIKSRGTSHSNQVRELILNDTGVTLADVYTSGGDVLMGTARWEHEEAQRMSEQRLETELALKVRELERIEADVESRKRLLDAELEAQRAKVEALELETAQAKRHRREVVHKIEGLRRADGKARP